MHYRRRRSGEAVGAFNEVVAGRGGGVEKPHAYRGPNQGHQAFGHHGAVEDTATHALRLQAATHQRALRGMEARHGTAGHGDEEGREDVVGPMFWVGFGAHVVEMAPQLGQVRHLDEKHHHQRYGHENQRHGKHWINLADNLVDGQHRGYDIVSEDDDDPHHGVAANQMQYRCRRVNKHGASDKQSQQGQGQRDAFRPLAQVFPDDFRQACAAVAHRSHAAQVVVYGSGEDGAEDDPQVGHGTELGTHDGTEDGACAGNIEELDHVNLPVGKHHEVNVVALGNGWRHAVVGAKYPLHETPVEQVAQNQDGKANDKGNHSGQRVAILWWICSARKLATTSGWRPVMLRQAW